MNSVVVDLYDSVAANNFARVRLKLFKGTEEAGLQGFVILLVSVLKFLNCRSKGLSSTGTLCAALNYKIRVKLLI